MGPPPIGPVHFLASLKDDGCRVIRRIHLDVPVNALTFEVQGVNRLRVCCYFSPETHRFLYGYRTDSPPPKTVQIKTMVGVRRVLGLLDPGGG